MPRVSGACSFLPALKRKLTAAAAFSAADAMRPAVLRFEGLPADVRVQKLELRFTGGDVALGEICSIVKK